MSRWASSERRRWKRRQKRKTLVAFGRIRNCVCTPTLSIVTQEGRFFFLLCCCCLYADWWSGINLTRCAVSFSNNFISGSTFRGHAVGLQECHFVRTLRILDFHCRQSLPILVSYYESSSSQAFFFFVHSDNNNRARVFRKKKEKKHWVYCDIFSHRNFGIMKKKNHITGTFSRFPYFP